MEVDGIESQLKPQRSEERGATQPEQETAKNKKDVCVRGRSKKPWKYLKTVKLKTVERLTRTVGYTYKKKEFLS